MRVLHVLVLLLLAVGPATAATTITGSILAGHPPIVSYQFESVSYANCGVRTDGVDGRWFSVAGAGGRPITMTSDETLDADLYFGTEACTTGSASWCAQQTFDVERCVAPAGTTTFFVHGFAGTGTFTITIG